MRVDPAVLVALAAVGGTALPVAPLATGLAALGVLALVVRRVSAWAVALAVLALGASSLRAGRALDDFETRRLRARDDFGAPSRCAAEARVVASPTWTGGASSALLQLDGIDCEGRAVAGPLLARVHGGPDDLARGDALALVLQAAPVRLFRNLELPDPLPGAARRGVLLSGGALAVTRLTQGAGPGALIDRARAHVRRRIVATFSAATAPMARALVLGENDLDPDDDAAFRESGLAHLLAVSGTHLVFAVVSVVAALRYLLLRWYWLAAQVEVGRLASALGVVLALVYADFAGGSGSAWRAAWMLAAALGVRALGRRPSVARSVAASLLVGAALDPLIAFDVSFLLSAAATAGLILLGPPLVRLTARVRSRALRWVLLSVAATVASMLPCVPLLALLAPRLTLAGVVANVVAAPLGEVVALPVCLLHTLLGAWPAAERGAALVGSGALLIVKQVASLSAAARFATLPVPPPDAAMLALAGVGALGLLLARGVRARLGWGAALTLGLGLLELGARRAGRPLGELRVSALDVGQGDALLVDLPDGRLVLVDGGGFMGSPVDPGRSVILPVLRARRRSRVDIAVLSHPHPDHFTGLATALAEVEVGELWDTGQGEAEGAGPVYAGLLTLLRARGVPVRRPAELCGEHRFGAARLEVLGPCPGPVPRRHANDNSFVLRLSLGQRAALLTGDAEATQEHELLARVPELRADYLKVGHHGSRSSTTPQWLRAVAPSVASISCGTRNPYGHPHASTLHTLAAAGVAALRMDHTGSVEWRTDGRGMSLRSFSVAH